jgi:hypothetical protein
MRTIDQHRDDSDIALERSRDLSGYEIVRIVEPSAAIIVLRIDPIRPDDGEQYVALAHLGVQVLYKVDASWDVIDVHE